MLVPVKYVGLKDEEVDHIYGSWVTWKRGEIQEVEDYVAMQLIKHPEFEDARHHKQKTKPIEGVIPERQVEEIKDEDLPPLVHSMESMTKDQIAQYARRNFGVQVEGKKGEMIEKVRYLMGRK